MRRTKRLFYVPGLISLIGLLIFLPTFYQKNLPIKKYCLTLYVPNEIPDKNLFKHTFSKYKLEKDIIKKKKISFTLDENLEENSRKMEMIRYEALRLKFTRDTSTVVLLTLSDSISYGEYISLVDMCIYDGHKRFASWDDKFVIFGEWPEKKKELPAIPLFYCGYQLLEKPIIKPTFIDLVKQKISKYYSLKATYLLAGWFLLLISFLYFRKRNSVLKKY